MNIKRFALSYICNIYSYLGNDIEVDVIDGDLILTFDREEGGTMVVTINLQSLAVTVEWED